MVICGPVGHALWTPHCLQSQQLLPKCPSLQAAHSQVPGPGALLAPRSHADAWLSRSLGPSPSSLGRLKPPGIFHLPPRSVLGACLLSDWWVQNQNSEGRLLQGPGCVFPRRRRCPDLSSFSSHLGLELLTSELRCDHTYGGESDPAFAHPLSRLSS